MRRLGFLSALLASFCSIGCLDPGHGAFHNPRRLDARITGIVIEGPAACGFVLCDFARTHASPDLSAHAQVADGGAIKTEDHVMVEVEQTYRSEHYAYTGVTGTEDTALGAQSSVVVSASPPTIAVEKGWGFFWGRRPRVRTDWVVAGTITTTIVVEQVDYETCRVYLIGPGIVEVTKRYPPTAVLVTLVDPDTYVEIKLTWPAGYDVTGPGDIAAAPVAIQDFIAKAKDIATAAGWP